MARIWFEPGTTQQYYPLLHTAFWVQHHLWGDAVFGYHLVSVLLHATSAILLLLILRRLEVHGAWVAAAIFAVHPLQVESVAWISEQKNTLSLTFFGALVRCRCRGGPGDRGDRALDAWRRGRGVQLDPR